MKRKYPNEGKFKSWIWIWLSFFKSISTQNFQKVAKTSNSSSCMMDQEQKVNLLKCRKAYNWLEDPVHPQVILMIAKNWLNRKQCNFSDVSDVSSFVVEYPSNQDGSPNHILPPTVLHPGNVLDNIQIFQDENGRQYIEWDAVSKKIAAFTQRNSIIGNDLLSTNKYIWLFSNGMTILQHNKQLINQRQIQSIKMLIMKHIMTLEKAIKLILIMTWEVT